MTQVRGRRGRGLLGSAVLTILVGASASAPSSIACPGVSHRWFSESVAAATPTWVDSGLSSSQSNGTLVNSAYVEGAVKFSGRNSHVRLDPFLLGGSDLTFATWVKFDTLNANSNVFSFGSGYTSYVSLGNKGTTTTARFAFGSSPDGATRYEAFLDGEDVWSVGSWVHVAVTVSQSNGLITMYRNGTQVAQGYAQTGAAGVPPIYRTTPYFGKSQFPSDNMFFGSVSDVQVYSEAMAPYRVQALASGNEASCMAAPSPPPPSPPWNGTVAAPTACVDVAHRYIAGPWPTNGNVLVDLASSPGGSDGTIYGNATYNDITGALEFDGNSYVDLGPMTLGASFTVVIGVVFPPPPAQENFTLYELYNPSGSSVRLGAQFGRIGLWTGASVQHTVTNLRTSVAGPISTTSLASQKTWFGVSCDGPFQCSTYMY